MIRTTITRRTSNDNVISTTSEENFNHKYDENMNFASSGRNLNERPLNDKVIINSIRKERTMSVEKPASNEIINIEEKETKSDFSEPSVTNDINKENILDSRDMVIGTKYISKSNDTKSSKTSAKYENHHIRDKSLNTDKLFKAARQASTLTSAVNGMKYMGKIRLIKCEDPETESDEEMESTASKNKVINEELEQIAMSRVQYTEENDDERETSGVTINMSEELNYREQIRVSDRLNAFKEKDAQQTKDEELRRADEGKRLEERRHKEKERLRKEEERKQKIQKELEEKRKEKEEQDLLKASQSNDEESSNSNDEPLINYEMKEVAKRRERMKEGIFDEDENRETSIKVNLSEELNYRDQVKVSDRLNAFREQDAQQRSNDQLRRAEEEKKLEERRHKEKERLRKEEERKQKIQKELEEKRKLKEEQDALKENTDDLTDDVSNSDEPLINYEMKEVAKRRERMKEGIFDEDENRETSVKVNLSEELKYRDEIKLSDRLSAFKDAEKEDKNRMQREKEENERKRGERQQKEQERLRKEEERKLKIQKEVEEKERIRKIKEEERLKLQNSHLDDGPLGVNLREEFKYRDEMDIKISDRLAAFKQAENEDQTKQQTDKEESDRKRIDRQQKEEERMRKEEERKQLIQQQIELKKQQQREQQQHNDENVNSTDNNDPDHIKQEREMQDQIEEQFRLQKYSSKGNKDVLKRWTSSNESEQSTSSEDSGIMNSEDTIELRVEGGLECTEFDPESERIMLEETEKAFQQYAVRRKSSASEPKLSSYLDRSSTPIDVDYLKVLEEEKFGLLERLEMIERKADQAKLDHDSLVQAGRDTEALHVEEEFKAAFQEMTRMKKRLKQLDLETTNNYQKQMSSNDSAKLSRECKAPMTKPPPPVNVDEFNDDGECVPEGIISNRLKSFSRKMKR